MLQQILQGKQSFWNLSGCLKTFAREQLSPNFQALRRVFDRCQIAFVCTQEEFKRLDGHTSSSKVKIVPHFVESRTLSLAPEAARKRLNLDEKIVITLLGFIYRGKGHDLLIKALANLPTNYQAVFAGGLGHESFLQEVMNLAKTLGVDDRVRVTGYLSEADQELYLAATHLAVCPFEKTSASGSLCTWISANKTIMAFDLPQIAEYNRLQPNAILTFSPYTSEALAASIQQAISQAEDTRSIAQLHRQLEIPAVFDQHLQHYTTVSKPVSVGTDLH
ncbi:MAG: glycosyltransferase [Leptolyngbyaceae cyanobacterium CSU_1_3]|nr:glycosyltransferase [Leptolyngbyaceae cyanobacterium CSU_1_3]